MTNSDITHLTQAIMELKGQIERMSERQEEMVEDVKKIKEAVYNPDEGIYARIRELEREMVKDGEVRMAKMEDTIEGIKKLQWMVIGTTVAAVMAVIFKAFGV